MSDVDYEYDDDAVNKYDAGSSTVSGLQRFIGGAMMLSVVFSLVASIMFFVYYEMSTRHIEIEDQTQGDVLRANAKGKFVPSNDLTTSLAKWDKLSLAGNILSAVTLDDATDTETYLDANTRYNIGVGSLELYLPSANDGVSKRVEIFDAAGVVISTATAVTIRPASFPVSDSSLAVTVTAESPTDRTMVDKTTYTSATGASMNLPAFVAGTDLSFIGTGGTDGLVVNAATGDKINDLASLTIANGESKIIRVNATNDGWSAYDIDTFYDSYSGATPMYVSLDLTHQMLTFTTDGNGVWVVNKNFRRPHNAIFIGRHSGVSISTVNNTVYNPVSLTSEAHYGDGAIAFSANKFIGFVPGRTYEFDISCVIPGTGSVTLGATDITVRYAGGGSTVFTNTLTAVAGGSYSDSFLYPAPTTGTTELEFVSGIDHASVGAWQGGLK